MTSATRSDLFHGTVFGLALTGSLWTLTEAPPPVAWEVAAFFGLAFAGGALSLRLGGLGRLRLLYPVLLCALILYGPGASLVAAMLGLLGRRLLSPGHALREPSLGFEIHAVALASTIAALVWTLAAGAIGASGSSVSGVVVPVALHAAAHGLVLASLVELGRRVRRHDRSRGSIWSVGAGPLARPAIEAAAALALVGLWAGTGTRPWIISLIMAGLAVGLARARIRLERIQRQASRRTTAMLGSVVDALAMMLEARDDNTDGHVRRVQRLGIDLGRKLGLAGPELEALATAALLHDIGKLAVPERILHKPGSLTLEEMDRIKLHPQVGASILETIPFPHPVAPIVRHHHERWDGSGYPEGLRGEEIPLGARILAAVDCFDALTSHRPYRRALTHGETIEHLKCMAGRTYDPLVVDALVEHLADWQGEAPELGADPLLARASRIGRATASATGRLLLAERELDALNEIGRASSHDLPLDDYLTLAACKLGSIVPFRSLVLYLLDRETGMLRAGFTMGQAADRLRYVAIPMGQRVSGRAAEHRQCSSGTAGTIPDLADCPDDDELAGLESTLVAPLVADGESLGTLTLYDRADRLFGAEDRRILACVAAHTARVARRGRLGEGPRLSLTDPLTGVPNGRFLFLESSHRISQTSGDGPGFGLLAVRVDGLDRLSEERGIVAVDRHLGGVARSLAAGCSQGETLVRFGQDVFIVLTPSGGTSELRRRGSELVRHVEQHLPTSSSGGERAKLTAAQASYPADGASVTELMERLDERLSHVLDRDRTVLPFRARTQASA